MLLVLLAIAPAVWCQTAGEDERSALDIIDDSHRHAGHAGHDGLGESHFQVRIVSDAFAGKSRVERQRLVYDLLAAELKDRVHALSLTTQTPAEAAKA